MGPCGGLRGNASSPARLRQALWRRSRQRNLRSDSERCGDREVRSTWRQETRAARAQRCRKAGKRRHEQTTGDGGGPRERRRGAGRRVQWLGSRRGRGAGEDLLTVRRDRPAEVTEEGAHRSVCLSARRRRVRGEPFPRGDASSFGHWKKSHPRTVLGDHGHRATGGRGRRLKTRALFFLTEHPPSPLFIHFAQKAEDQSCGNET